MNARALTIAGSDSGGGAGIQADLKTFHQLGAYGMSVVTVLTAQNTLGVQGISPQSLECVEQQLDSVLMDIGADAVKTGMLYRQDIIEMTAAKLRETKVPSLVVDPVMLAKGGTPLLRTDALHALKKMLIPLATVVAPNLPEACELANVPEVKHAAGMEEIARRVHALGPKYVLLKGGHLAGGDAMDLLFDGDKVWTFTMPRIQTAHTHGTGCTLSAALTAELAKGSSMVDAVQNAKLFLHRALTLSAPLGRGIGPALSAKFVAEMSQG